MTDDHLVQDTVMLDVDVYRVAKSFHFSEGLQDELLGIDPSIKDQILHPDKEDIQQSKLDALAEKRNKKMLQLVLER